MKRKRITAKKVWEEEARQCTECKRIIRVGDDGKLIEHMGQMFRERCPGSGSDGIEPDQPKPAKDGQALVWDMSSSDGPPDPPSFTIDDCTGDPWAVSMRIEDALNSYAENDTDGQCDSSYGDGDGRGGCDFIVRLGDTDTVWTVQMELEPTFRAWARETGMEANQ